MFIDIIIKLYLIVLTKYTLPRTTLFLVDCILCLWHGFDILRQIDLYLGLLEKVFHGYYTINVFERKKTNANADVAILTCNVAILTGNVAILMVM